MMQKLQNDNGCANLEFSSKYISKILCKKLYLCVGNDFTYNILAN